MNNSETQQAIDWSLTTWEGSRREQYRRWSQLTLREILLAQEEMQKLAEKLNPVVSKECND
ncbi:MAG: hypothetical protein A2W76_07855 [Gammaproteobacteria bacterium RIFCSPLOWO2_12_47_11]|jgi:hypothetical protein|nr:MAG: hypothetical protein A2W76_07855 [Gammaproteobacteria bacterium RIFCSPLOWO2_12_47_11]